MRQLSFRLRIAQFNALARGALSALGGRRGHCVVCSRDVLMFLPWRGGRAGLPPLMIALGMVGSDVDRFACPRCGATDRDRHLRLYLEQAGLSKRFQGARVLHFAPEQALEPWLQSLGAARYVRADLFPARAGIERLDLQALPFESDSFDIVIANHVLEHVDDLDRATAEIGRVLAPDGIAILQTPWCSGLSTTIDDPAVRDAHARWALYGQADHVRLFGRDIYERIARGGLQPTPLRHADALPDTDPAYWGVNPAEDLMLFRKH